MGDGGGGVKEKDEDEDERGVKKTAGSRSVSAVRGVETVPYLGLKSWE